MPVLPLGAHRTAMRPGTDLSPRGLARLVADVLEALDLRDVVLVGNDTGGAISQLVAAHHPERLAGLVLTDCDAYEHFPPPVLVPLRWLGRAPRLADAVLRAARFGAVRTAFTAPVNRDRDRERIARWVEPLVRDPAVRRDVIAFLAAVDPGDTVAAAERLRSFGHPALVIWSRGDRVFPLADAHRLVADLPDARLELIDGARAFVSLDAPDETARLIATFVAER